MTGLIRKIASNKVINQAYDWLCKRREKSHHNNGVWHLRYHWETTKRKLQNALLRGDYQFSPCRFCTVNNVPIGVWCAEDALVLKAITLVLTDELKPYISRNCYHLKGHGGAKAAVMKVANQCAVQKYVMKSDATSYYASINHKILLKQLSRYLSDKLVITLIERALTRLDDIDGALYQVTQGISKGCPLSPLLGALYLSSLDGALEIEAKKHGLCYARFMDDWVLLCKTRNQLRKAVKIMNLALNELKLTKHPYKTYIGRLIKGFDFLGYRLGPKAARGVGVAWLTLARHIGKLTQLYEQGASTKRIEEYAKRWRVWVRSGVDVEGSFDYSRCCYGLCGATGYSSTK